jgi:hypothetical protein
MHLFVDPCMINLHAMTGPGGLNHRLMSKTAITMKPACKDTRRVFDCPKNGGAGTIPE